MEAGLLTNEHLDSRLSQGGAAVVDVRAVLQVP